MRNDKTSKTAEQVALSRAIETLRPMGERICADPFAERFLGTGYRMLLTGKPVRNMVERLIESSFPGHHYYVIARTRYIDDFLKARLDEGFEQLVILGAGFDSRPYRFAEQLEAVRVFEVDHPATLAIKRHRLKVAISTTGINVSYVPVNFNSDSLAECLRIGGYQYSRKTVFLWEGVTPYLKSEAVDSVLQFVSSTGGEGTSILFDYILHTVVEGQCQLRGAQNEFQRMQRTEEPLVFGINPESIEDYLSQRSFKLTEDVGAEDLLSRYFKGRRGCYVKPWWRITQATVI